MSEPDTFYVKIDDDIVFIEVLRKAHRVHHMWDSRAINIAS